MHEAHEINIGGVWPRVDYFSKFEFLDTFINHKLTFKGIK